MWMMCESTASQKKEKKIICIGDDPPAPELTIPKTVASVRISNLDPRLALRHHRVYRVVCLVPDEYLTMQGCLGEDIAELDSCTVLRSDILGGIPSRDRVDLLRRRIRQSRVNPPAASLSIVKLASSSASSISISASL